MLQERIVKDRVVVVGAGVAGLASALALSARGLDVTVLERSPAPGGKLRQVGIGPARIDSGPTVFTMRWVFEELFAAAGRNFSDHVRLRSLDVLARHAWDAETRLDLFADEAQSADAIGDFAGRAEAQRYRKFCADSRRIYQILEAPFLRATAPSLPGLVAANGLRGLLELPRIRPFTTMWKALGDYFHDPRLHQLFGRYATYCGSSPYAAPATLMLVAHVEQQGVWIIDGGMHALASAIADCATAQGASILYNQEVSEVITNSGRACGVRLASGEQLAADAVIVNADVGAVSGGLFGASVRRAAAPIAPESRSLSAITWSMVAKADGFPLSRHSVFFSRDYAREFADIFGRNAVPDEPTVYVCGQDRIDNDASTSASGEEELFVLINAPPVGDTKVFDATEIERYAERTFGALARCGLRIERRPETTEVTTPSDFNRMFPATGGALYGRASHGWTSSFARPGARTSVPGLYLAGGSTHPGPGVPMAALSGRAAAASLLADIERDLQRVGPAPVAP
ncbi:MAG: phytoene desaturase [Rhodopseudomonas sp.]|uniref:1-hydroxycarotenoid 3,4-desaturase CrtD n=1 Tax=Rhodopseudomonas sp. TaxID=1078 RepID=UPI00178F98E0|nr:1-hydroxycarotenoid 3,4-desaturase CrtD [Rhodopseudomonas sp.]NVN84830.1 phytoene desaturase [Rhodopseudomonas sp.]